MFENDAWKEKALLSIVKPGKAGSGSEVALIDRCEWSLLEDLNEGSLSSGERDRLIIQLHCRHGILILFFFEKEIFFLDSSVNSKLKKGIVKTHALFYEAVDPLLASYSLESCTHSWSLSPKLIQHLLGYFFVGRAEEMSLAVEPGVGLTLCSLNESSGRFSFQYYFLVETAKDKNGVSWNV